MLCSTMKNWLGATSSIVVLDATMQLVRPLHILVLSYGC